jgi:signal transduction histidine kinase
VSSTGFAGPTSLRQLLDAVMAIGADLDLGATLRRIIEAATALVDARYGALGVLNQERNALAEFITVGIDERERRRIGELPKGHGILGLLIADPRTLRLPDLSEHPDRFGFPSNHPEMRSFLGVPIMVRNEVFGNLYLTDKRSAEVFTDIDQELTIALAAAAGVAIENARLHARVRELVLLEDRERIAMDLHDTVIQRLFATGMSLQATERVTEQADVAHRIQTAVEDLDATIGQIRSSIFALSAASRARAPGLRARLLDIVGEMSPALASDPRVQFAGPVDTTVPEEMADELVVILRELLSNVARHAQAKRVDVLVRVDGRQVILRVVDDGAGLGPAVARSGNGLRNLEARAARAGGSFALTGVPDGGTRAEWRAPLPR